MYKYENHTTEGIFKVNFITQEIRNKSWHREEAPAWIEYYENGKVRYEEWYLNDKRHRKNGSAIIEYYEDGKVVYEKYYLYGKELTKEEYYDELFKIKLLLC